MKDVEREQVTLHLDTKHSTLVSQKKDDVKVPKDPETWFYMGLIGQIGYSVALPMVLGAFGGDYIDKMMHTTPRWTLYGLFGGVFISIVGFVNIIQDILKKDKKK